MSPQLIGGIGVCGLFSLLIIRVPVWVALTLVGFLGNVALIGVGAALATLGTIPFDTASLYGLSVIPLFILTGSIASGTGLSAELGCASHPFRCQGRAVTRDHWRLGLFRRRVRLFDRYCRHHDPHCASRDALRRLWRCPFDGFHCGGW